MANSTRRGRSGRVDVIEVFSPRRSGPWHLLRPVRSRWGLAALIIVVLVCLAGHHQGLGLTVAVISGVLLVLSFAFVWQLVGLLIRSRAELATLAGGVATDVWLRSMLSTAWADALLLGAVTMLLSVPVTGRYVIARFWCVLDRHRLRLCLRQTKVRTMNMDGSLPLLLWSRPTKIGERVWVWVRAGSSADDIADAVEYIAPACYAREARIQRVRKLTTLVGIDIIRRDPLGVPAPIPSPLAQLSGLVKHATSREGTDAIRPVALTDITTTVVPAATSGPQRAKTTAKSTASATPPVVMVNGEDISDYID